MNKTFWIIRTFFVILTIGLTIPTAMQIGGAEDSALYGFYGIVAGVLLSGLILGIEPLLRGVSLRSLNICTVGVLSGCLLASSIDWIASEIGALDFFSSNFAQFFRLFLYLFSVFTTLILTVRSAEDFYICLPFFKFKPASQKDKDILLDASIVQDSRLIDLANSGLVDRRLVLPRFLLKSLYQLLESADEQERYRSKRALDVVERLENIVGLELRIIDIDFPELKDNESKVIRLARIQDLYILTADLNKIQQSNIESIEGIKVINLHTLAQALKPLAHSGDSIEIKIQRYGKEPRQGVGYLEDGTMVVVNGGADFIGLTIPVQVLSIKHTSSGRMIFTNALSEEMRSESMREAVNIG